MYLSSLIRRVLLMRAGRAIGVLEESDNPSSIKETPDNDS